MKTYQDLIAVGQDDKERMSFILSAIREHQSSKAFKVAENAMLYYGGENPTINHYEKIIYDLKGKAHRDEWTANHKIASKFFGFVVDQEVSYLLGNGITFGDDATAKKLGDSFDLDVTEAARNALISGVAFGFWNLDHLQVFKLSEFAPLYDEENGSLRSGIRWWQIDDSKPLRATLYEEDGYTEYIQRKGKDMEILAPKRPYKVFSRTSDVGGTEIYGGENYPSFPIVPLTNGENSTSEIVGKRNTIDALDLASSNMVNNVDEGNLVYWAINNAGGMDAEDDARFIDRIRTTHVAHVEDDGAQVEPHTIEAPYAGTGATIDMLKKKLYEDFQAFDSSAVTAGAQTATAIKASYVPLDLKTDKFEAFVTKFILGLLEVAGIDDKPSYTRNQIINKTEEINAILAAQEYFDEEYITRKLLTINGDADLFEEIQKRKTAEETERIAQEETEGNDNTDDSGAVAGDSE